MSSSTPRRIPSRNENSGPHRNLYSNVHSSTADKGQQRGLPAGPAAKTASSPCRGPDSTPGQGTRSYMPQLSSSASKTRYRQI